MSDISKAREEAAQAWCMPTTSGIEMDIRLAEAFALILEEKNNQIVQAKVCGSCEDWNIQDAYTSTRCRHTGRLYLRDESCSGWRAIT